MTRPAAALAAIALSAALTGCTERTGGVLDPIMDPPDPSITVTVPTVTTLVPPTDLP